MATLIFTVLLGLMFAYFAVLNTQTVSINLINTLLTVPLFVLVIVSILIGLLISAVISSIDWMSSSFALRSRDSQIKQKEQSVRNLEEKVHNLEVENARLKGEEPIVIDRTKNHKQPFLSKFTYHQ